MSVRNGIFILVFIFAQAIAFAGAKGGGGSAAAAGKKHLFSISAMALTSSTKQGGQGPSGSTILSQAEYVRDTGFFGYGLFFLYDMQGSKEKDTAYGPKIEFNFDPFFLEYCYAFSVNRAYTDRSIANETGDGSVVGAGMRFSFGGKGGGGGNGWFFQASYKMRTFNIKKQDGAPLDQPVKQEDAYPLIGLGFSL